MIISIANQKGGVNKTTLTFNLSHLVAETGKKVLMVDFDPQASLTAIVDSDKMEIDVFSVLDDHDAIAGAIVPVTDNLDLMVGSIGLAEFELAFGGNQGRESMLKNVLATLRDTYEYIFIDCPPALGLLLVNALNASNGVIIPLATDFLAYKGFDLLLNTIAQVKVNMNPDLEIVGVVATMHDARTLHNREVLDLIIEEFDILGIVGVSTKVKDANMSGIPIHQFDKKHKISKEYERIARRILNYGK